MKQQQGSDAGIELFISIPIHGSDPLFLRAMHRGKGEDFRSIKRQARADMVFVGVSTKQAKTDGKVAKMQMDRECGLAQEACYNLAMCKNDMLTDRKQHKFICSPSSSSSSSSSLSSVSDLFTIDEKEIMEFIDERSKPRFRLLTELY